jgi:hypothetical protein
MFTSILESSPSKRPMTIRQARLPYASDVTKGSVGIFQGSHLTSHRRRNRISRPSLCASNSGLRPRTGPLPNLSDTIGITNAKI